MKRLFTVFALATLASATLALAQQAPPTITLKVIKKDGEICVDESNYANEVKHRSSIPQTIAWRLDSAVNGTIVGLEFAKLQNGYEVHAQPQDPPFNLGSFKIAPDGQGAKMSDLHKDVNTVGTYPYDLIIQVGSDTTPMRVYSCPSGIGTNSNASIKNK